ncbi:hypothetical protein [Niabella aurantiaca]|uniref:hypothetical protein n=1 Tax=Niabella aurantiaca TaxID=379900 RepID=UPI0003787C83|nr:hypothetical protein [Niabella aurantiaca]
MDKSTIYVFIDEAPNPVLQLEAPVNFELDTHKLTDGEHILKIVSRDPSGKEGIRKIPFVVRNGPAIAVEGIREHEVVDGILPVMIHAYGKGDSRSFLIEGSETPQSIPLWIWVLIIAFTAWTLYYLIRYLSMN